MAELTLYSAPGCHLCEQALALIEAELGVHELRVVDIEGDLALTYRYGVRIPVLRRADSGAELSWPFDRDALREWLVA
ncbi:MAG: glutaredoxin family protein [Xanthomonadales bacterium]|nr:glutaredoxin family protein [Xanthomonadales bacterium]NIN58588.1 glutaredoxin family protein [Xanthomonadales bacterium]NIN73877.1 glutaredoxin family protein [Xanthomonadales bacterium]NIO12346.1 glutaredoxin family protein [Xanthomonadales bacterium]NIP10981.1 glutaredoxin family protein [Xanthomonadales bacterium]